MVSCRILRKNFSSILSAAHKKLSSKRVLRKLKRRVFKKVTRLQTIFNYQKYLSAQSAFADNSKRSLKHVLYIRRGGKNTTHAQSTLS